jgi:hypothetical protein
MLGLARESMKNCEAMMDMLLIIVDRDDAPEVARIRSQTRINTTGDDSALRLQSQYRQGVSDALYYMVQRQ